MEGGDFTEVASIYARSRPEYPSAIVDRLVERSGASPGDEVVEIGAGTGIFSRLLADRGLRVMAVEPCTAMSAGAATCPGIAWRSGTFEKTGLAPGSCSWVVAAQAFHWAETVRALREVRRILVPSGKFTVLWNCRQFDRNPLVEKTREIILSLVPGMTPAYSEIDWGPVLCSTSDFTNPSYDVCEHAVSMDRERYLDLWRGHKRLRLAAGERQAAVVQAIERLLEAEGVHEISVPFACRAWTVQRSGSLP
jgi:SAM-dependent methyltransferase